LNIHYATLETCSAATGTVVVIDVWRSFTTAACAFDADARDIVTVASAEEALALRERFPDVLLMGMGELGRPSAEGFDFANSPTALMAHDLHGQRSIQCTPNGTQGIVRSVKAETLLASSFVCARATANYIRRKSPAEVTFVSTDDMGEDQACAEYIAALLCNQMPETATMLSQIREPALEAFRTNVPRGTWTQAQGAVLEADLECCLSLDRFNFAMLVERRDGLLVMKAVI
jgi:2-phosphosulfolactate phosphatase